jgi:hypothetical protein
MSDLTAATSGDLAAWRGLRHGTQSDDVQRELPGDWTFEAAAGVRVGRSFGILRSGEIEVWIPTGATLVSSVEFPARGADHTALLAQLGEPELAVTSRQFAPDAFGQDRIYASNGLTVSVAEPFDGGDAYVVFVQLYEPTDTTGFLTLVGQSGPEMHAFPADP